MEALRNVVVWRVEDKNGCGPYRRMNRNGHKSSLTHSWELICAIWGRHSKPQNQPAPRDDFDNYDEILKNKALFGFLTYKDVKDWFGEDGIRIILEGGYKIRTMKASMVWVSKTKKQIAFVP